MASISTAPIRAAAVVASLALVSCAADDGSSADVPATVAADESPSPATTAPTTTVAPSTTSAPSTSTTTTSTTTSSTTTTSTTTSTSTTTTIPAPASARYRVTIVQEWGPATHPQTVPPGWHSSPAVLVAHAASGAVIPVGGSASPGVESMAETGKTAILSEELAANPDVAEFQVGQGIQSSGTDVLEVAATQSNSLMSLVTMLAPSPDWFVGVVDVALFEGNWLERTELDLIPYDAGTDSGGGFTSDDADTEPRQPISSPRDGDYVAAAAEGRFGYVVIERIG